MRTRYISRCPICGDHESRSFADKRKAAKHAAAAAAAHNDLLPEYIADSIIPPNRRINGAFIEVVHHAQ